MESPGISIIIPVFNTSETLMRCVDSLRNQTFSDFEAILVNDGSTDNSEQLCKLIVASDSRFSYYSKTNGGLSSARNYGTKFAIGTFIAFLDSDDYVHIDFCKLLFATASRNNLDLLNFGLCYVKDGLGENRRSALPKDRLILRDELINLIADSSINKVLYFSWSNLYRKSFLIENNLVFDERVLLGEDTVFNLKAHMLSRATYSISDPLYHYVYNTNSLTQKKFKDNLLQKFESQFRARMEIHRAWPEINSDRFMRDIARNYVETTFFMLLANLHNSEGDKHLLVKEIRNSELYRFSFQYYQLSFNLKLTMWIRVFLFRYRLFGLLLNT